MSITWSSLAPNVIAVDGEVTRPAFGETNATVTLTATLSRRAATNTKNFILTVLSPRLIDVTTLEQLNAIRYDLDGNGVVDNPSDIVAYTNYTNVFPELNPNQSYRGYKLMTNLDFAGSRWASNQGSNLGWDPIGTYDSGDPNVSFRAIFEGNSNVISGLYINRPTVEYIGLFGGIRTTNAELRNLGLSNLWITGSNNVGGLVGRNNEGGITASYVTGTVTGSSDIGGLVGYNDDGRITTSYATGMVTGSTGSENVGGLVGRNTVEARGLPPVMLRPR